MTGIAYHDFNALRAFKYESTKPLHEQKCSVSSSATWLLKKV
jgi:hypothetical protein